MEIFLRKSEEKALGHLLIALAQSESLKAQLTQIESRFNLADGLLKTAFLGDNKEVMNFFFNNMRVTLLGVGKNPGFSDISKVYRLFIHQNKTKLNGCIGIEIYQDDKSKSKLMHEGAINGLVLGTYCLKLYKTDKNGCDSVLEDKLSEVSIETVDFDQDWLADLSEAIFMAKTQLSIYDLVNAPANKKLPQDMANWAKLSGKKYGYEVKVLDQKDCEREGLDALLAVNKGSTNPPVLIVAHYKGDPGGKTIGLVGKGVTFDTGGMSIKPSSNMHFMKCDMGGAAAVLGCIEMAAKAKLKANVVSIVPATENTIDGLAIKPGDVIGSYSKKTIEVIDTDAEGRLILADGLAYMIKNFAPDTLIDVATLTGNSILALGFAAAAMFTNSDASSMILEKNGNLYGEKVWRMPLWDSYKEDMMSDIADIRNLSLKPVAGAITAAKFLEFFTENHPDWVHLDIAGVAYTDNEFSTNRSSTAWGIRLLFEFLKSKK